jgi:alpha-galactosidase
MGWNPWYEFRCGVNEKLVQQTAQAIVSGGYRDAGYDYVNLDDCWMALQRSPDGELQADPARFPHGISALAAYVHGLKLKLGVYIDAGTATCQGLPGSAGHLSQDAVTLASWGVDFVKVDFCNTGLPPPEPVYSEVYGAFAAVARPIVLSVCEWGFEQPWQWAAPYATMWRTTDDYTRYGAPVDYWHALLHVVDVNAGLARFAHPGAWNDPDMLLAGTGLLTASQERAQVSLWAMMAAPLLIDADLTAIPAESAATLTDPEVIAVDQDPAGMQGVRITGGRHQVWVRRLRDGSRAVLLFNAGSDPTTMTLDPRRVGLPRRHLYLLRDLWAHRTWFASRPVSLEVAPGDVEMLRVRTVLPLAHR